MKEPFALIIVIVAMLAYEVGYVVANSDVATECQRIGGFYVGSKTFTCYIKETK